MSCGKQGENLVLTDLLPQLVRTLFFVILVGFGFVLDPGAASAQDREIIREVMGSGGEIMQSDEHTAHGTISQTTIGRVLRPNRFGHNIGFWYWAREFGSYSCIRLPKVAADPGTTITIPLILEESNDLLRNGPLRFRARIRYNGTLLEPDGATPPCTWEGDDCVLEFEGTASVTVGVIAELSFIVKLGNNVNTPLIIEEFVWLNPGDDQTIRIERKHGEFTLLGICREGHDTRLIMTTGAIARLTAMPNPARSYATVEFITGEDGPAQIQLVDGIGNRLATLVDQEVEGDRAYQAGIDLTSYSSGSYFLVLQTPTVVRSTPFIIQQ